MESKAITVNIPRWETDSLELICGIANAGGGYVLLPTCLLSIADFGIQHYALSIVIT